MTHHDPNVNVDLLQELLTALERLVQVPPTHTRRLTPMLRWRLRDVILAYLCCRELAQQLAGVATPDLEHRPDSTPSLH